METDDEQVPPDRIDFERRLESLHSSIRPLKSRFGQLVGYGGQDSLIRASRLRYTSLRNQRTEIVRKVQDMHVQINTISQSIAEKKTVLMTIEKSLLVRNEDRLRKDLAYFKHRYENEKMNRRTEEETVREMDRLSRALGLLQKYKNIQEELRKLQGEQQERRNENRTLTQQSNELRARQEEERRRLKGFREEANRYHDELALLHANKNELIEWYNKKRCDFTTWLRSPQGARMRKVTTLPSTDPTGARACTFGEELEPFYEQKRHCKRLLNYLAPLEHSSQADNGARMLVFRDLVSSDDTPTASTETVKNSVPPPSAASKAVFGLFPEEDHESESESSADELPASFARLMPHHQRPSNSAPALQQPRPGLRRIKKHHHPRLPNQPLSHDIDIIRMFNDLDLSPPLIYADVTKTVEQIRQRLEELHAQTAVVEWSPAEYGLLIQDDLCARSQSENDSGATSITGPPSDTLSSVPSSSHLCSDVTQPTLVSPAPPVPAAPDVAALPVAPPPPPPPQQQASGIGLRRSIRLRPPPIPFNTSLPRISADEGVSSSKDSSIQ